jgi:hypothetical protein
VVVSLATLSLLLLVLRCSDLRPGTSSFPCFIPHFHTSTLHSSILAPLPSSSSPTFPLLSLGHFPPAADLFLLLRAALASRTELLLCTSSSFKGPRTTWNIFCILRTCLLKYSIEREIEKESERRTPPVSFHSLGQLFPPPSHSLLYGWPCRPHPLNEAPPTFITSTTSTPQPEERVYKTVLPLTGLISPSHSPHYLQNFLSLLSPLHARARRRSGEAFFWAILCLLDSLMDCCAGQYLLSHKSQRVGPSALRSQWEEPR